jgi:hypothetical protein
MHGNRKHEQERNAETRAETHAEAQAEAEAAAAVAATESDDSFVDADEPLESEEEPR